MSVHESERSWGEAFGAYFHPKAIVMLFLGFSSGLPILLIFSTLSGWLTEVDVSRSLIGLFSWVGLMYSVKVFWAPVLDRIPLPVLTALAGQRRGWLFVAQAGIVLGLMGIASSDPASDLRWVAMMALLVAFSSATQDVVIDAYRIEAAKSDMQGALAAMYQGGYRLGMIMAGAGAFYVAHYVSWPAAYLAMASLMSVGFVTALLIAEPERRIDEETMAREAALAAGVNQSLKAKGPLAGAITWFSGAVVSPFTDYFARAAWMGLLILLFVGAYRLSDITMGIMANPFYLDLGFSKLEIANVSKLYGVVVGLIGAFVGGLCVVRFGVMRPLLFGAVLAIPTNLLFAWLATQGPNVEYLVYTISADNFAGGFAGTCLIAYMSSLVNQAYTATQYALFSSFFTLPGKFIGGFSGFVVEGAGYEIFFVYAAALGLPAVIICLVLMRYGPRPEPGEGDAEEGPSADLVPAAPGAAVAYAAKEEGGDGTSPPGSL